jgi:hypothetical protein
MDIHTTNSVDNELSLYGRVMQLFQILTYHTNVLVIPEYKMFKDKVLFKAHHTGRQETYK